MIVNLSFLNTEEDVDRRLYWVTKDMPLLFDCLDDLKITETYYQKNPQNIDICTRTTNVLMDRMTDVDKGYKTFTSSTFKRNMKKDFPTAIKDAIVFTHFLIASTEQMTVLLEARKWEIKNEIFPGYFETNKMDPSLSKRWKVAQKNLELIQKITNLEVSNLEPADKSFFEADAESVDQVENSKTEEKIIECSYELNDMVSKYNVEKYTDQEL